VLGRALSLHTYQSRNGDAGSERADWNHGWSIEVWFATRSTTTRMPMAPAWFMKSTNSPEVPRRGLTP
jgi:hypothetical protein